MKGILVHRNAEMQISILIEPNALIVLILLYAK